MSSVPPERLEKTLLWLGPGERLAALEPVLRALAARAEGRTEVRLLASLEALEDELEAGPAGGDAPRSDAHPSDARRSDAHRSDARRTLLLDADQLGIEDLGWLRRLFTRDRALRLFLCGDDPGRRSARTLLRLPSARWTSWPPDVEDLGRWIALGPAPAASRGPAPHAARATRPAPASPAPASFELLDADAEELAEIEAILEVPLDVDGDGDGDEEGSRGGHAFARAPGQPRAAPRAAPADDEAQPFDEDFGEASAREDAPEPGRPGAASPARVPAEPGRAPAPWFRDQVADLADIAQRIELSLEALPGAEAPAEALRGEVARLLQFTRTLGFLVAPPPPGGQVFDLGEMLRIAAAAIVARGADAPRCLVRGTTGLLVRSDRALLEQAFDALFFLVGFAAQSGDVIRVQGSKPKAQEEHVRVSIEFPSGALYGLEPEEIVEPYGLRSVCPALGPNALSAAIGILRGQGGDAELRRAAGTRLEWLVRLPRQTGLRGNGSPTDEAASAGGVRAEDPFA